jgi:hypothetical protein
MDQNKKKKQIHVRLFHQLITLTKNPIEEWCSMDVFKDIININITN